MADSPTPPPPPPEVPPAAQSSPAGESFNIGEEYGTARKNLPPVWIVIICVAVVAAIAAIYAGTHRAHQPSRGSIDDVVAAPMPGQQMIMAAINVSLQNNGENPIWIKSIQVDADVNGNKLTDEAAPAVDAARYFQAMPELKQHALDILTAEKRVNPGTQASGTVVVSFATTPEAFAARKSLSVTIMPYNELPIVLTK
jgi:hypothetical protein